MKRMHKLLLTLFVMMWVAIPMLVVAQIPSPTAPENLSDTIELVKEGIDASKTGGMGWVIFSIAVIKAFWLAVGRIPSLKEKFTSWGVEINVVLSATVALLSLIVGGASWTEVLIAGLIGPLMGFFHDTGKLIWNLKKQNDPEE